tara:strand:+ start:2523 stop:2948 length:426 start_codon:yes stop_codon:yes gene_type:complete
MKVRFGKRQLKTIRAGLKHLNNYTLDIFEAEFNENEDESGEWLPIEGWPASLTPKVYENLHEALGLLGDVFDNGKPNVTLDTSIFKTDVMRCAAHWLLVDSVDLNVGEVNVSWEDYRDHMNFRNKLEYKVENIDWGFENEY